MNTNTPTPRTDAAASSCVNYNGSPAVSSDFARQLERDLASVTAERDELKKSRDAAAWANQQLTLVLINAGAPEFSSAAHALEWATETATLRARVAELESAADKEEHHRKGNVRLMARVHDLGQRVAELVAALRDISELESTWPKWSAEDLYASARITATEAIARAESTTPAPHADTVRLDWLDEVNQQINRQHGTVYGYRCDVNHNRAEVSLNDSRIPALTVREAIDAARHRAKQEARK